MAVAGFPDLKIQMDVSSGGALGDISAYVTEMGGWSKEAVLEEITAAGDSDDRHAKVGITRKGEIVFTGPYDTTTDKLVDITKVGSDLGETRTIELTFESGDVETFEAIIMKVERNPTRDALHSYSVTLRPTGAVS